MRCQVGHGRSVRFRSGWSISTHRLRALVLVLCLVITFRRGLVVAVDESNAPAHFTPPCDPGIEWCQFLNDYDWFSAVMTLGFGGGIGLVLMVMGIGMLRASA